MRRFSLSYIVCLLYNIVKIDYEVIILMNASTHFAHVITDENFMEATPHGTSDYPFRFHDVDLALFNFNCIEWHWHTEVEFVYVKSGTVTFWIGEKTFKLSEGNGVFINSKVIHRFRSSSSGAVIPNFVLMPSFIAPFDSYIYQNYVLPIISSQLAFQVFQPEIPWQNEALSLMKEIIGCQAATSNELITLALSQMLWEKMYKNVDTSNTNLTSKSFASSQAKLQIMMQYIHQNYKSAISLDDIAACAAISKSSALNLFRRYMHITPINYLIQYRLNEASLLLAKTEQKIATISSETGFNSVDYFCRLFKIHYLLTPTQYRKNKQTF